MGGINNSQSLVSSQGNHYSLMDNTGRKYIQQSQQMNMDGSINNIPSLASLFNPNLQLIDTDNLTFEQLQLFQHGKLLNPAAVIGLPLALSRDMSGSAQVSFAQFNTVVT